MAFSNAVKCALMSSAVMFGLGAGFSSSSAQAQGFGLLPQERGIVSPEDRGINTIQFVILPELDIEAGYSSNYLRSSITSEGSTFISATPSIRFLSNWNRHVLAIDAYASGTLYGEDSEDNAYTAGINGQFVLDITRSGQIKFNAGYDRLSEARGSDNTVNGARGATGFGVLRAGIEGRYKPGDLRISPFVNIADYNYDNTDLIAGGSADNSGRNYFEVGYGVEVGYEYRRGYELFVRGFGLHKNYDQNINAGNEDRDSTEYGVLGGMNLQLTNLIEGRVGIGYTYRDMDSRDLNDTGSFSVDVGVTWTPTPAFTVTADAFQSFSESTTADVSAINDIGARIGIDYALREDISISSYASYTDSDFKGSNRNDDTISLGIGIDYEINRYFSVGAGYAFTQRDSNIAGNDWTENRYTIGLKAHY